MSGKANWAHKKTTRKQKALHTREEWVTRSSRSRKVNWHAETRKQKALHTREEWVKEIKAVKKSQLARWNNKAKGSSHKRAKSRRPKQSRKVMRLRKEVSGTCRLHSRKEASRETQNEEVAKKSKQNKFGNGLVTDERVTRTYRKRRVRDHHHHPMDLHRSQEKVEGFKYVQGPVYLLSL